MEMMVLARGLCACLLICFGTLAARACAMHRARPAGACRKGTARLEGTEHRTALRGTAEHKAGRSSLRDTCTGTRAHAYAAAEGGACGCSVRVGHRRIQGVPGELCQDYGHADVRGCRGERLGDVRNSLAVSFRNSLGVSFLSERLLLLLPLLLL
jgi:hypothetical protein